jgi:hypothetical protein
MQWITNSRALILKQYVAQFLGQHYLSSPVDWLIDEQCEGITLIHSKDEYITFDDRLLIDLDRNWLNPNFVPIPLRNGIAHPNHAAQVDDWATIFYLLSQYSECMHEEKDMHQRISAVQSLVVEKRWHERCLVNECAERILASIQSKIPSFQWHLPKKSFRISHNVDRPFKYDGEKWKTHVKRALGSYRFGNSLQRVMKELMRLSMFPMLKNRIDPFNHFQWMVQENRNFKRTSFFFIWKWRPRRFSKPCYKKTSEFCKE